MTGIRRAAKSLGRFWSWWWWWNVKGRERGRVMTESSSPIRDVDNSQLRVQTGSTVATTGPHGRQGIALRGRKARANVRHYGMVHSKVRETEKKCSRANR